MKDLAERQAEMKERMMQPPQPHGEEVSSVFKELKRTKPRRLYTVHCPCGATFCTTSTNAKKCFDCRKGRKSVAPSCRFFGDPIERKHYGREITADYQYRMRLEKYGVQRGHTYEEWRDVLRRQGYQCHYCLRDLLPENWSRDHKIPISKGGSDEISNIVAACKRCNSKKGTLTEQEYFRKLSQEKEKVVWKLAPEDDYAMTLNTP